MHRVLLALFVIGLVMPSFASAQYSSSHAPYEEAVAALQQDKIVDFSSNVRVHDRINRAEALKVIMKSVPAFESDLQNVSRYLSPIPLFPDINQQAWYAPYIELGFTKGIVKGYPNGLMRPEAHVNVVEAIAMVTRAFGERTSSAQFQTSTDLANQQNQWFTGAVSTVLQRNAIKQGSRLSLSSPMTRGQLFDLVYRMRTMHLQGLAAFPGRSRADGSTQDIVHSTKPFSITIPTLGIHDMTVTHPDDPFTQDGVLEPLSYGLGHLLGFPGQGSKVMIYGHSSSVPWDISQYSKIFRRINELPIGERIFLTYEGKTHVYQVTEHRTVAVTDPTPYQENNRGEELILYTCWPPDTIDERYVVFASPL